MNISLLDNRITLDNISFDINWNEKKVNFEIRMGEVEKAIPEKAAIEKPKTVIPWRKDADGYIYAGCITTEERLPEKAEEKPLTPEPIVTVASVFSREPIKGNISSSIKEEYMARLEGKILDYVSKNQPTLLVYTTSKKSAPKFRKLFENFKKIAGFPPNAKLKEAVFNLIKKGSLKRSRGSAKGPYYYSVINSDSTPPAPSEKKKERKEKITIPELKENILSYLEGRGGSATIRYACGEGFIPETKKEREGFFSSVKCRTTTKIRQALRELQREGLVTVTGGYGNVPCLYNLNKPEDEKSRIEAEAEEEWTGEYWENIEDRAIIRPIPPIPPLIRRAIKDPCPKCGGNTYTSNTKYQGMDALEDGTPVISCLMCGSETYPDGGGKNEPADNKSTVKENSCSC